MENYITTTLTNLLKALPGTKKIDNVSNELEIRVGRYGNVSNINTGNKQRNFISEVSRYVYNNLITNLLKDDNYTVKRTMNKIMLFDYDNGKYRYIESGAVTSDQSQLTRKKLIQNIDLHNIDLRLSYNTEESFSPDPSFIQRIKNNNSVRKDHKDRIRTSFYHKTIGIVIDLTQDTIYKDINKGVDRGVGKDTNKQYNKGDYTLLKGEKVYQWEVEFLDLPKVQSGELPLEAFINTVISIINFVNSLKNKLYYDDSIQNRFNQLYTKKDRFLYKKPVNIKEENIPYLQNYLVRPKLDGVAYFLVILDNGIFLLNNSDTIPLPFKDMVINTYGKNRFNGKFVGGVPNIITEQYRHLINTIILTEYMDEDKTLYNYLLIKLGGKDVGYISLENNMLELKNISESLNSILDRKFDVIKINRFYTNEVDSSKMLSGLLHINLPNDGLIFEPIYRKTPTDFIANITVSNVSYKWKPETLNSIDLLTIPTENKNWYTVFMETKKGLEPFIGTYDNEYGGLVYITDEFIKLNKNPDYTIIEYTYDRQNRILAPYRIRWDKTEPNFIDTVLSVWSDMMNPITEKHLLDISPLVLIKPLEQSSLEELNYNKVYNTEIVCEFLKKTINPFIFKDINTYLGYTDIYDGYKQACSFKLGIINKDNIDNSEYKKLDIILMMLYEYFSGRLDED